MGLAELSVKDVERLLMEHTYDYEYTPYTANAAGKYVPGTPVVVTAALTGWNDFCDWVDSKTNDSPVPGLGVVEQVKEYGGMGQGDDLWVVFKVAEPGTGHERYFRVDGYYSSYEGCNWEDASLAEVTPRVKTVIVYE